MDTEKAYWDSMYVYIKKELKCDALVTGTSVFGPGNMYAQSDMDFLDGHAYWEHPQFPRKAWDTADWVMVQRSMVANPAQATLPRLAAERLAGKPFTVSEYNHPAPQDAQVECVPMVAAIAAAQDWDGVWFFAYSHRGGGPRDRFDSFFDIDANPSKLGFLPAGAAMFRQGMVKPLVAEQVVSFAEKDGPVAMARLQASFDTVLPVVEREGFKPLGTLHSRLGVTFNGPERFSTVPKKTGDTFMDWRPGAFRLYGSDGSQARQVNVVMVGRPGPDRYGVSLVAPKFAAVTVTPLDGLQIGASRKLLVTACGRCENVGMGFNADRTSVGGNWGTGPTHIEAVTATIVLPGVGWTCHALRSDGSVGEEVPVSKNRLEISPQYKTMWYVLTR